MAQSTDGGSGMRLIAGVLAVLVVVMVGMSLMRRNGEPTGAARTDASTPIDGAASPDPGADKRNDAIELARAGLAYMTTYQEMYYTSNMAYTKELKNLEGYSAPKNVDIQVLEANNQGWSAVARVRGDDTKRSCVVAVGGVNVLPMTDRDRKQPGRIEPGEKIVVCDGD
jgi:hypothetical protein